MTDVILCKEVKKIKKGFCIDNECNKQACFNFSNEKSPIYCGLHKLDNMINVKISFFVTFFESCIKTR